MFTARISPRWSALALLATGVMALASTTVAPSFASDEGQLYVIQGLPGKVVDVAIDGHSVAKNVRTAGLVGPFEVAGGKRVVSFSSAGKEIIARKVKVSAKSSSDVVVHLPAVGTGDATVTAYRNDLWSVPKDKAALSVSHTAAVPAADIRVNNKVLFKDISNGQSLSLVVPVATYSVGIVPTGKASPYFFGPVDLTVKGGALNRVYAIGDPKRHTMNVTVHVLTAASMGSDKPTKVDTGTGGAAVGQGAKYYYNLLR